MFIKSLFPLFIIVLIFSFQLGAIEAQDNCNVTMSQINPGEELHYNVSYNWFVVYSDVGYVKIKADTVIHNARYLMHIDAQGQTTKGWDRFFKVRDRYQSWVSPLTMRPNYFHRQVDEGGYRIDVRYDFNRFDNRAYMRMKKNEKPVVLDTISIGKCTFDVISIMYYLRHIDFKSLRINDTVNFEIILDGEVTPLYIRFLGDETIRLKELGKIHCLKFSAALVAGSVFKGGEDLVFYVTHDANHIPVYAESPILIGKVKVRLVKAANLKYDPQSLPKINQP